MNWPAARSPGPWGSLSRIEAAASTSAPTEPPTSSEPYGPPDELGASSPLPPESTLVPTCREPAGSSRSDTEGRTSLYSVWAALPGKGLRRPFVPRVALLERSSGAVEHRSESGCSCDYSPPLVADARAVVSQIALAATPASSASFGLHSSSSRWQARSRAALAARAQLAWRWVEPTRCTTGPLPRARHAESLPLNCLIPPGRRLASPSTTPQQRVCRTASRLQTSTTCLIARDTATFTRQESSAKAMLDAPPRALLPAVPSGPRTVLTSTTCLSSPWKASTVATCTLCSCRASSSRDLDAAASSQPPA